MKSFHKQFCQCTETGYTDETEFLSFEDHPEFLPAFPKNGMKEAIESGEWTGINTIICGRFGGRCSGGHKKCKEMRKLTIEQ